MKDLKIDADLDDLFLENFDLALVEGVDRVVQSLKIRLRFFFSEWFLDDRKGIKFYEQIYLKSPNLTVVDATLKASILDTADVTNILEYSQSFDRSARTLTVSFMVDTTFGETSISEVL